MLIKAAIIISVIGKPVASTSDKYLLNKKGSLIHRLMKDGSVSLTIPEKLNSRIK
tara:strand:+ start:1931 stop:2095 length:165 start_codon:yes stop_codon:yes gene_type:complete